MNADDITFGIEIETTIPRGVLRVGPHGAGYAIPGMDGWKADRDPSIHTTNSTRDHEGCEFVSPVFRGVEGLKQALADLAKIKALGARVNQSCGLHVHVGFDKSNAELLERFVTLVANFEKAIYATTGTKRRESSRWCNSVKRYGSFDSANRSARYSRYHVANIATDKPTVEIRAFGATLDAVKLTAYVMMCVGLVERAMRAKRDTNWNAKTPKDSSPIHRNGAGQTEVNRLFYQLGWTRGRQPHVHGNLQGDGIPTLKAVKRELMRLALKYDAPPEAQTTVRRRDGLAVGMQVRLSIPGSQWDGACGEIVALRPRRMPIVCINGCNHRVAIRHLVVRPVSTN